MIECRTDRLLVRELRPDDRDEYVRCFETGRDHFAPWFPEATPEERFERELAKRYLRIAGAWRDHVMFARTVEEHRFAYLPKDPEEETK